MHGRDIIIKEKKTSKNIEYLHYSCCASQEAQQLLLANTPRYSIFVNIQLYYNRPERWTYFTAYWVQHSLASRPARLTNIYIFVLWVSCSDKDRLQGPVNIIWNIFLREKNTKQI